MIQEASLSVAIALSNLPNWQTLIFHQNLTLSKLRKLAAEVKEAEEGAVLIGFNGINSTASYTMPFMSF